MLASPAGRLDHLLGGLLVLTRAAYAHLEIDALVGSTRVLRGPRPAGGCVAARASWSRCSRSAARRRGVTTEDLAWPLVGETLEVGTTRGVSNRFVSSEAAVSLDDGCLLVIDRDGGSSMRSRDSRPRRNGVRNPSAWLVGGLVVLAMCGGVAACGDDGSSGGGADATEVRLVTYSSFALPEKAAKQFEKETGAKIEVIAGDDSGAMLTKALLSRRLTRGRRHLRNRQHVGHPGDVGGPARAVPRSTDRLAPEPASPSTAKPGTA